MLYAHEVSLDYKLPEDTEPSARGHRAKQFTSGKDPQRTAATSENFLLTNCGVSLPSSGLRYNSHLLIKVPTITYFWYMFCFV